MVAASQPDSTALADVVAGRRVGRDAACELALLRAPENWPSRQEADLVVEFELRGLEPPFEQVLDEMDPIAEYSKAAYAAANEQDLSKAHEAVERDLAAHRKRWN